MERITVVVLGLFLTTFGIAGVAVGHSPNTNGNCSIVNQDETLSVDTGTEEVGVVYAGVYVEGVGGLYVHEGSTAPGLVWLETNGFPGLQTHGHTCRPDDALPNSDESIDVGPDTALI